jgi:hypothetical protein
LGVAVLDRVDAVGAELAAFSGALAGFGEGEGVRSAKAEFAKAAGVAVAEDPGLGPAGADLEVEAAAVSEVAALDCARDGLASALPIYPYLIGDL